MRGSVPRCCALLALVLIYHALLYSHTLFCIPTRSVVFSHALLYSHTLYCLCFLCFTCLVSEVSYLHAWHGRCTCWTWFTCCTCCTCCTWLPHAHDCFMHVGQGAEVSLCTAFLGLVLMCDMSYLHVSHDSLICLTRLMHECRWMCRGRQMQMQGSIFFGSRMSHVSYVTCLVCHISYAAFSHVCYRFTWLIHTAVYWLYWSYVRDTHVSSGWSEYPFTCVTWLVCTCDRTHSFAWYEWSIQPSSLAVTLSKAWSKARNQTS